MKKFMWWFAFFVFVLAVYSPAIYQFIGFVIAWLATLLAVRLTWR